MKGGGTYVNTVQFRSASKGGGYFYNLAAMGISKIVIETKATKSEYVPVNPTLSVYVGDTAGEDTTLVEKTVTEGTERCVSTYILPENTEYFVAKNDENYAVYMYSATLYF